MARWFNFLRNNSDNRSKPKTQFVERDNSAQWIYYFNQFGIDIDKVDKYCQNKAFEIAGTLPEVFFPIDYIADACAGLDYKIVYEDSLEEFTGTRSNIDRLIKSPNPYQKFSDLVYLGVFSKLADGNTYDYVKIPDSYKNITPENITNIWTLSPDNTFPIVKKEIPNPFGIKDTSEIIEKYKTYFLAHMELDPKYVYHHVINTICENGKAKSPLNVVSKNINNLLQVYSARYNVYAKSLNGGILSYDGVASTDISAQLGDTVSRDAIIKDISNRNGITGDKNFIGITSIPLKFVKTIPSIKDLAPFEETEADAIAISGIFGIPSSITPKKSEPKYSNANESERKVWQNIIIPYAIERGQELARVYQLPDGVTFYPDFSSVEILQDDKKTGYEADKILIDNLSALRAEGEDVSEALKKITDKYNES